MKWPQLNCGRSPPERRLYAAQQPLAWALDPTSCASPLYIIEGRPSMQPVSKIVEKGDCLCV
jgi:hypothetical protein